MNSSGGGGSVGSKGNGATTAAGIPAEVRKIVQNIKEIVDVPDQEIYAALRDCNMDPSEAVQRLLSQDSFHEVKSKRDRKKEVKESPDSRSRTANNALSRGVRGVPDRVPRTSLMQSSFDGYSSNRGKGAQKKEDGMGTVSCFSTMGSSSSISRKSTFLSENSSMENSWQSSGSATGTLNSQSSSTYPHNWAGMPGQFSMADIVKMGRPHTKLSAPSTTSGNSAHFSNNQLISDISDKYFMNPRPSEIDQRVHFSEGLYQPAEDKHLDSGTTGNEHASDNSWTFVNQPNSRTTIPIFENSIAVTSHSEEPDAEFVVDEAQFHQILNENEASELEQSSDPENLSESEDLENDSDTQLNSSENKSKLEDGLLQNESTYLSQKHLVEKQVDDAQISLAATNLQNLRLQKNGVATPSLENNPSVIIPRHLQVNTADCSHLSFGSFGSAIGSSFPSSLQQKSPKDNSEVTKDDAEDVPLFNDSETRYSDHYENELNSEINEDAISRSDMSTMAFGIPSASEPERIRDDAGGNTHDLQYSFSSLSGYGTSISTQLSATALPHSQSNLQMQNLTSLSNLMQPYTSSLPSNFLVPALQPLRDIDLPFSSLLATQSQPTKHNATTSITGQAISIHEAKPSAFSNLQQIPQSSTNSNLHPGHAIPQHLHMNPYSQATLPLGPFANVISYPFLPQSYTYVPSAAFPQAYSASNSPFHQSSTAIQNAGLKYTLPQYKSSLLASSLPQPATVASAYGNYNSPANTLGNFVLNPSTASTSSTIGFDEGLSSQKEAAHYFHLQQNESSPMWAHGGNSRTVPPLPTNTFYGYQGQGQLNSFRQAQQPEHYGPMGYLNLYQNHQLGGQGQQEHQQIPAEANLNGSQGNQSQQSHQMWQHGY